ncbi:MAG: hypothetical protein R2911_19185 [Caldilineaceae bacterium]
MIKEFILENCGPLGQDRMAAPALSQFDYYETVRAKPSHEDVIHGVTLHRGIPSGDNRTNFNEVLGNKLRDVFQVEKSAISCARAQTG